MIIQKIFQGITHYLALSTSTIKNALFEYCIKIEDIDSCKKINLRLKGCAKKLNYEILGKSFAMREKMIECWSNNKEIN